MTPRPSLASLALLIARDASRTLGGTATTEVLRRTFVGRGLISHDQHARLFGLSRLTPGTNLIAYCTGLGLTTRGLAGAAVACLAASIPCSIMAVILTWGYERVTASRLFAPVLMAAMTAALALVAAGAWNLARPHFTRTLAPKTAAVITLVLALMALGVTPVRTLLAAAAVGALWPVRR
jgi:chromate transporter